MLREGGVAGLPSSLPPSFELRGRASAPGGGASEGGIERNVPSTTTTSSTRPDTPVMLASSSRTQRSWLQACCLSHLRSYASTSSRAPPTAFERLGYDGDELQQTPPLDVKAQKKAWKAQQAAEKEALNQARLQRMADEVERGKRHKVGDWKAHLKEQAREREEQDRSTLARDREDKRRRNVEKFLVSLRVAWARRIVY